PGRCSPRPERRSDGRRCHRRRPSWRYIRRRRRTTRGPRALGLHDHFREPRLPIKRGPTEDTLRRSDASRQGRTRRGRSLQEPAGRRNDIHHEERLHTAGEKFEHHGVWLPSVGRDAAS
ncbi:unnamed protein product, partial [Ectocarpus fasciculatus]